MKRFVLIQLSDRSRVQNYEADEVTVYGGPWGDSTQHASLEVPEGIDYRTHDINEVTLTGEQTEDDIDFDCKHTIQDSMGSGETYKYFKFVSNSSLVDSILAEDREVTLNSLRTERNTMFDEADNEIRKHDDADANKVGTDADWKTYRTSLRNVTDSYKTDGDANSSCDDLVVASFSWPTKPS